MNILSLRDFKFWQALRLYRMRDGLCHSKLSVQIIVAEEESLQNDIRIYLVFPQSAKGLLGYLWL